MTSTLPNAIVDVPYSETVAISGGIAPFIFTLSGGVLPSGLTLNSTTGVISGTPSTLGFTNFGITVTDGTWPTPQSTTESFSIRTVLPPGNTVTYNGNGSTGGTVPTDATAYLQGATVTVLGNTGTLTRTGYIFDGWNSAANGSGSSYAAGATFAIGTANVTLYAQWKVPTLTVAVSGNGSGSINSDPAGITCSSGNTGVCSKAFPSSTATLFATPSATSALSGWTGCSSIATETCFVSMTGNKSVSATFIPSPKAMIGTSGYDTLNQAYSTVLGGAAAGATIKLLDADLFENLNVTGKDIVLDGGYSTNFTTKSGLPTVLNGKITIKSGTLRVNGLTLKSFSTGMVLNKVTGGTFTMGDTFGDSGVLSDELPTHQVTLSDFYIGKYEVTQAEWQTVMTGNTSGISATPSFFPACGASCPVEGVSWNDIQIFISRLNSMSGKNYRLPTEAEWEYAARSGGQSQKYSGGSDVNAVAWYSVNSGSTTHTVGTKQANGLGLYDMSGNVWECVSDWYGAYGSAAQTNPTGPATGSARVFRGGSWRNGVNAVRASYRGYGAPADPNISGIGFRLVAPVQ